AEAQDAQAAVREYLTEFGHELGIAEADVGDYRLAETKTWFDTTTYCYEQTVHGLPVWGAGIGVHVKTDPLRVLGAQATLPRDLAVAEPAAQAMQPWADPAPAQVAALLTLAPGAEVASIASSRLVVYRYEASRRVAEPGHPHVEQVRPAGTVDSSIADG